MILNGKKFTTVIPSKEALEFYNYDKDNDILSLEIVNYEIVNLEELVNKEFEKWKKVNANRIIVNKGEKQSVKLGLGNFKYKLYPIKSGCRTW